MSTQRRKMGKIEIKSEWLAYALGARKNIITLDELENTKILDFNLVKYLNGNSDIFFYESQVKIPDNERIEKTKAFISELTEMIHLYKWSIEHIRISGLDFKKTHLDFLYEMKELKQLILQDNRNCVLNLTKLKNIKEMELSFDGVETKRIDITHYTKEKMELPYLLTQYDIYLATRKDSFENMEIDIMDINKVLPYTNKKITVSIKNVEDVKRLKRSELKKFNLSLRTSKLQDLAGLSQIVDHINELVKIPGRNIKFNQVINNVSQLSVDQLKVVIGKLVKEAGFNNVKVFKYPGCYDKYSIQNYGKIRSSIDEIIDGIDTKLPDVDKFIAVQNAIIYTIAYDFDEDETQNATLEDGLINKKCVCATFSDILRNALHCVNIEANYIKGMSNKGVHTWNQVKLGYDWYNIDIVFDRYNIILGGTPKYCLKSDLAFYKDGNHIINDTEKLVFKVKPCNRSYSDRATKQLANTGLNRCEPNMIMDTVEEFNYINNSNLKILFEPKQMDNMQIVLADNNDNEVLPKQYTGMCIKKDDIGNFVKTYFNRYNINFKGHNAENSNLIHISNNVGPSLILGPITRKRLYEEGIMDLRTTEERLMHTEFKDMPIDMTMLND